MQYDLVFPAGGLDSTKGTSLEKSLPYMVMRQFFAEFYVSR